MVVAAQHSEKIKYLSIGQISLKGFAACAECHCCYDHTTELTCPGRSPCPAATACLDPLGKASWAFHRAELKQCTCQAQPEWWERMNAVISSVCLSYLIDWWAKLSAEDILSRHTHSAPVSPTQTPAEPPIPLPQHFKTIPQNCQIASWFLTKAPLKILMS